MRNMLRNTVKFHFASYAKREPIMDDYGNETGQYELIYGEPIESYGNISAAMGEIQNRQFGESESYDKVIVLDKPNTPINEYSILWVDTSPFDKDGAKVSHDYVVKKVARSLNSVSIAISKVDVDG